MGWILESADPKKEAAVVKEVMNVAVAASLGVE
jgi:hypothetical protein